MDSWVDRGYVNEESLEILIQRHFSKFLLIDKFYLLSGW